LAACAAVGIVGALSASGRQMAPSPESAAQVWASRRVEAVEQLSAHPRDPEAALTLSRILAKQATAEAQESSAEQRPRWGGSRRAPSRSSLAACLTHSADMADAEALARQVAATARGSRLRARAWAHLASMSRLRQQPDEQLRSMQEAAREDPAQYEAIARDWRERGVP